MPLAEFQAQMRGAIIDGAVAPLAGALTGGGDPLARFAIHRRHYEASLVRALVEKFPALVWLAGSPFVTAAAGVFVRQSPPRAPCIAEYGQGFPAFIASRPQAQPIPWLGCVGELEWRLGRVALALEYAPLPMETLAAMPERLAECAFEWQPGLDYFAAPWPADDLVKLFLSDAAPERYTLNAEDIFLEVRGARGAFSMTRLDRATFIFRDALWRGATVGDAAEQALDADAAFDAGQGLVQLIAAGLAISIIDAEKDSES